MFDFNHTIVYNSEIMKTKLSLGPDTEKPLDIMMILSTVTVSVGFFANLTVVVVFVKHRKLRRKIPNIFFINQVSHQQLYLSNTLIKNSNCLRYLVISFSLPRVTDLQCKMQSNFHRECSREIIVQN